MTRNTLEFTILSEAVNQVFEVEEEGQNDTELFWDRFSDSCPVSYGDASFTIVQTKVVLDTVAEVDDRTDAENFLDCDNFEASEGDWKDAEARAELFSRRCKALQKLILEGPEYVDLEG
jgi:hypothetical protein